MVESKSFKKAKKEYSDKWVITEKNSRLLLVSLILIIACIIYSDFIFGNKLYMYSDVGADTINSYYPFITYLSELLEYKSLWSSNMGIGNNMVSISMFLLDPFNWILFMFNDVQIAHLLVYIMILKLVFSGLLFQKYISYISDSKYVSIVASVLYAFSGYMIVWGQHYQFSTIIVLTALFMLGFERWFKYRKWGVFLLSNILIASFTLYYFYILTFFIVIYFIYRCFEEYKLNEINKILKLVGKTIVIYCCAGAIGAVFILPNLYLFLSSPRVSGGLFSTNIFSMSSAHEYFTTLFRLFSNNALGIGNDFFGYSNYYEAPNLYMGIFTLIIFILGLFISDKKSKIRYSILMLFILITLIFPYFSIIMNGFSATSPRWTFILIILTLYVFVKVFSQIEFTKINKVSVVSSAIILFSIIWLGYLLSIKLMNWSSAQQHHILLEIIKISSLILIYIVILLLWNRFKKQTLIKSILVVFILVEAILMSSASINNRGVLNEQFVAPNGGYNVDKPIIDYIQTTDQSIYRIEKESLNVFLNDSLMQGYMGIPIYNSLVHPSYLKLSAALDLPLWMNNPNFIGPTNDSSTLSLLGIKYYVSTSGYHPNGFIKVSDFENKQIYLNSFYNSLGYAYSSYMSSSDLNEENSSQIKQALMKTAVVEDQYTSLFNGIKKVKYDEFNFNEEEVQYFDHQQLNYANLDIVKIDEKNVEFTVNHQDPQIIVIEDLSKSLLINEVSFEFMSNVATVGQIFWSSGNDIIFSETNSLKFEVFPGTHTYKINLGGVALNSLRLDPTETNGIFNLSNLNIEIYNNGLTKDFLNNTPFNITKYNNGEIKGVINVSDKSILAITIPFDQGWKAFVNGEEVTPIKINYGLLGLVIDEGESNIELEYNAPLFREGLLISLCSTLILLIFFLFIKRKSNNK